MSWTHELFFSEVGANYAEAADLCAICPVPRQCAEEAEQLPAKLRGHGFRAGVPGGVRVRRRLVTSPIAESARTNQMST